MITEINELNNTTPKYMKQKLKKSTGKLTTILLEDFNTLLSVMDRQGGRRSQATEDRTTMNKLYLTDSYRTSHPTAAGYSLFSHACGRFFKRALKYEMTK